MGLRQLLNRLRTIPEPDSASQDAPGEAIEQHPLPDDLRQALYQLRAEWAEMQLHWSEVLDKLQAWSARQSARDRKAANKGLDRLAQTEEIEQPGPQLQQGEAHVETKDELRRRAAALYRRQA